MAEYPFKDLLPLDEVLEREGYYNDWTHLDPEVFYSLTQISEYIKTKGYGVDVRLLISQLAEHFGLRVTQITDAMNEFNDLKPKAELSVSQSAEALTKSQSALNVANSADTLSKSVQEQFNQVVIDGDSSVEAAQARVDASGQTNPTLKARLDKEHNEVTAQLAQNVTNPMQFDAKADGLTDDTNALENAINNAVGHVVDLKSRTYAVSGVRIDKPIHLKNGKITLLDRALQSAIEITTNAGGTILSDIDVVINKETLSATDASGIFVNNASDVKLFRCTVNGSKNDNYSSPYMHSGIYGHGARNLQILNCTVKNTDKEGIMARMSDDVFISHCQAFDCGYSGVGTSGGSRATITHCKSIRSGTSSITVNSSESIVTNNHVKDNTANNGITVGHSHEVEQNALDCIVSNNMIENSAGSGITIASPKKAIIVANNIANPIKRGIEVSTSGLTSDIIIANNTIDGATGGVEVYGDSEGSLSLSNNTFLNDNYNANYLRVNGVIKINGNTFKGCSGGVFSLSYFTQGAFNGFTRLIEIENNLYVDIETTCNYLVNYKNLKVVKNIFENVNTSNNANGHAVRMEGNFSPATGGVIGNSHILDNILIDDIVSNFCHTGNKTDELVSLFTFAGNILNLSNQYQARLFTQPTKYKILHENNRIGSDDKVINVTLPTGQTSVTISNSNWVADASGLLNPILQPKTASFYEAKPFVSSISNASITIKYIDTGANIDITVKFQ